MIFDIKRCAIHDGPGIRTTVFLKGCPLQCLWCHNPESIRREPEVKYVAFKCCVCGACVGACRRRCHRLAEGEHRVRRGDCIQCGSCAAACPSHALEVVGRTVSVDEVMAIMLKDVRYYASSGGGMTLSGGEPLLQAEFARALLAQARRNNIHTCFDTSGYGRTDELLALLEFVDIFLYDFKESDDDRHREFTGVGNRLILEHLAQINERGKSIVLRCPIIPGLNDRPEHFARIAQLSRELANIIEIDVLPFHPFAADKCAQLHREYRLGDLAAVSRETAEAWIADLQTRVSIPVRHG